MKLETQIKIASTGHSTCMKVFKFSAGLVVVSAIGALAFSAGLDSCQKKLNEEAIKASAEKLKNLK